MSESPLVSNTFFFPTEDGEIFYEVIEPATGTGEELSTLTLLHNFMSTGRAAWGSMVARFAERYRVLLPDLPGHGQSIGHPADFHYGKMAEQLAALMAHEAATGGHLAGCSAGGMIAQLLVSKGLATPDTLTLVSTTYSINKNVTGAEHTLNPENFQAGARWMAATAKLHDPYRYAGYYQEIMLPAFRRLDPALAIDLPLETLATWQMPVCIIHGAEDEFFPLSIVEAMAAALPDHSRHVIADQPHALIFRQPWRVQEIMLTFLQEQQ